MTESCSVHSSVHLSVHPSSTAAEFLLCSRPRAESGHRHSLVDLALKEISVLCDPNQESSDVVSVLMWWFNILVIRLF